MPKTQFVKIATLPNGARCRTPDWPACREWPELAYGHDIIVVQGADNRVHITRRSRHPDRKDTVESTWVAGGTEVIPY